jgi:TetR/AcrR family transcriptional repressor of nem operon
MWKLMSQEQTTKEKILTFARDRIQYHSYNAFSYAQIAEYLDIRKASVHYHFPTKGDLGVAILQEYRQYINELIVDLDARTTDPWKKMRAYFRYFLNILEDGDKICTECILSAEYNTLPERMQVELTGLFEDHHTWLTSILEAGRDQGRFSFKGSARDKAFLVKAALQGGITIARAFGQTEFITTVIDQLSESLNVNPA